MPILSSTIQSLKVRRTHKKQTRTALHMLALSGVVRPGHIELRYATPITSITAFRSQPAAVDLPQIQPIPSQPESHDIICAMTQTRPWTESLVSAMVQFAKRPVMSRWTKQLDA
jgi:hypothetical protein